MSENQEEKYFTLKVAEADLSIINAQILALRFVVGELWCREQDRSKKPRDTDPVFSYKDIREAIWTVLRRNMRISTETKDGELHIKIHLGEIGSKEE